jgi:Rad3-related DNA helicase
MNTDMQAIFGPEGPFAKTFPDYEVRPGQEDLARRVWDLCESSEGGILAAEAPTGIGKSFALLVPALLWAQKRDARILFLTREFRCRSNSGTRISPPSSACSVFLFLSWCSRGGQICLQTTSF